MDALFGAGIGFGFLLFSIIFIPMIFDSMESTAAIPPTPAFQKIATNDTDATTNPSWVNATQYNDELWIVTDGSILIEVIQYSGDAE